MVVLLVATDTAGQTENGSLQCREHRPLHGTSTLAILFQHVTEAVLFEVDLANKPAITAIIIKNFSLATGEFFLLAVAIDNLNVFATRLFPYRRPVQLAVSGRLEADLVRPHHSLTVPSLVALRH